MYECIVTIKIIKRGDKHVQTPQGPQPIIDQTMEFSARGEGAAAGNAFKSAFDDGGLKDMLEQLPMDSGLVGRA